MEDTFEDEPDNNKTDSSKYFLVEASILLALLYNSLCIHPKCFGRVIEVEPQCKGIGALFVAELSCEKVSFSKQVPSWSCLSLSTRESVS